MLHRRRFRFVDAFYLSVITLTTVGYGDLAPESDVGMLFTAVYALVGIGILLGFVTTVGAKAAELPLLHSSTHIPVASKGGNEMDPREPLPYRSGPPPETIGPRPHAQVTQTSPPAVYRELAARALKLEGVQPADSLVSVPGALAFVLDEKHAGGPPAAFQAEREFAHLHPQDDSSLHMTLPPEIAAEAYEKGWGEPHPYSGTPLIFGPRDEAELEVVWRLLQASHEFAKGAAEG